MAESKLFANVKEGKETSIFYILNTLGRTRGYVQRQEHANSGTIKIEWEEIKTYEADKKADNGT